MNSFINKIVRKLGFQRKLGWIPDDIYLKCVYQDQTGEKLDLINPRSFNEKIQWLKLYNRQPQYTDMVDKYRVRNYVKQTIGEQYLVKLIGVWKDPNDIDFSRLPDQFVLKCNHNSSVGLCICRNKALLNINKTKKDLCDGLEQNFYLTGREWPYKMVHRLIICEEYLEDPQVGELRDYKFFNFNGVPKLFKIDFNRFSGHRANYYDLDGNILPFGESDYPPDYNRNLVIPDCISKMIDLSSKLSAGIPFVRTDFYCVEGKIYFGEMTFFPASGFGKFTSEEWNQKLGSWINLPDKK